jgi:hypothetical protein
MSFVYRRIFAFVAFLAAGVTLALAEPTATSGSGTNRVDYASISKTNEVSHAPRWYEEPVKDPLSLLQELQAKSEGNLEGPATFTMEDGLYSLSMKQEGVPATTTPKADKLAAWDASLLHKEAPLDFSTVAVGRHGAFQTNEAGAQFVGELAKGPDSASGRTIQFRAANDDANLEAPTKTHGVEDDGLPGPAPSVPAQAQPQIASPEPDIMVLGIVFLGAWRLVSVSRRRN